MLKFLLEFLSFVQISSAYWPPPYQYEIRWYDKMPIDHFSFNPYEATFSMRYLINDTYFDPEDGPIFFYAGNEGDITLFANNTGLMWDNDQPCRAMVVLAEHRYYGETLPYGQDSYEKENLAHLTSEQALADFAVFLSWLKSSHKAIQPSTPVIAFGGSYGGMLAAWMRIKYPHIIAGALASSAPVIQFTGITKCQTYTSIVSSVYANSGFGCAKCIKDSWSVIRKFSQSNEGRQELNRIFNFCPNSLVTDEQNASQIIDWLSDIWGSTAMINYPYETNFLNPVPAWPVAALCQKLNNCDAKENPGELLSAIHNAASVYLNYTGSSKCFSFTTDASRALGTLGWDFQACTEMVMPMCNSEQSMFEKSDWNFSSFSDDCFRKYGVRPREDWAITQYGGFRLTAASRIIFSNGDLDPWSGGGILYNVSDTVISLVVHRGAHHYDLRGKHPSDTADVKEVRRLEAYYIHKWCMMFRKEFWKQSRKAKMTMNIH